MKIKSLYAVAVLVAAISTPAIAENFSYSYLQVGYSTGDVNVGGLKVDSSGLAFSASAPINDTLYVVGGYANQELSLGNLSVDGDSFNIGVGARTSINQNTDLTTTLSYVSTETNVYGLVDKATGYELDFGVRHKVNDSFELLGGFGFTSAGSPKINTTSVSIGGRYKVNNNLSVGAGYSYATNEDADARGIVVATRFEF